MSVRQRDQSEKNLSYEVQKMQQDIQASERERYRRLLIRFVNIYIEQKAYKRSVKSRKVSKLLISRGSLSILVR